MKKMKYIAIKSIAELKLDAESMILSDILEEEEDFHEKICRKLRSPAIKLYFGEEIHELYMKRSNIANENYEIYIKKVKIVRLKNDIRVVF